MKNRQEKSAEQWQLSNATKQKLFFENILYIKYKPQRNLLQRLLSKVGVLHD